MTDFANHSLPRIPSTLDNTDTLQSEASPANLDCLKTVDHHAYPQASVQTGFYIGALVPWS